MSALASSGHNAENAYRRLVPTAAVSRCSKRSYSITSSARSRDDSEILTPDGFRGDLHLSAARTWSAARPEAVGTGGALDEASPYISDCLALADPS
jgi:hypothetical protein